MKLFAPSSIGLPSRARNDSIQDAETSHTWWPWFGMAGAAYTTAGLRVNEDIAMTFSACFAATRIISETLAALPLYFMEQLDERHSQRCTDDLRYFLLHDQPNPEQDSMTYLDMQTAFQVNWGNAYAEIQRDRDGNAVAYWPIHPSRIPPRNISRNPHSADMAHAIKVGDPGEIVYWVNNDDGTKTPIPARDMLHIPGVLSQNGITGQGIIRWGANSIGVGLATDRHAAAFFRNGAVSNVAITSPKIVGEETAQRLRAQWQQVFGGVDNHYKTLLLEDGMKAEPMNLSAEDAQLIQARQFGVTEIARWYRLPPHMLADLSRSSFTNIESENLSFVIHSMMPWIVRWERALNRQLLAPTEKGQYFYRFNVNGLLRGDHAARAAFYTAMFKLGSYSPNDIRANEDLNPVAGGDTYFVEGNNMLPLTMAAKGQGLAAPNGNNGNANGNGRGRNGTKIVLRRMMGEMIESAERRDSAIVAALQTVADRLRLSAAEALDRSEDVRNEVEGLRYDVVASLRDHHFDTVRAVRDEVREQERIAYDDLIERTAIVFSQRSDLAEACRGCLQAVLTGMMALEKRSLLRAAEKPGSFIASRTEMYADFAGKLADQLGRFAGAAAGLGIPFDPAATAAKYCAGSQTAQDELLDVACADFKGELARLFDSWEANDRPKKFVADMFSTDH